MKKWLQFAAMGVCFVFTLSCSKDKVASEASSLAFSIDTLFFDTVFTEVGTATRNFKIYNRSKEILQIKSIEFATPNSPFRMNVDGRSGIRIENLEILPNDSAYIFVEATINPNGLNSPMVINEDILFQFEKGSKSFPIVAWGQDAIYIRANTFVQGLPPYIILPENATWTSNKPYVIYGYAVVDSARSLTVEAGTKVHFHGASGLWVYRYGQISVNGTKDQPVVFQSDRLEAQYNETPGLWDRIWINEGPQGKNNVIRHAIVKNAFIGIQAEVLPLNDGLAPVLSENKLILENCIVQNNSGVSLYGRNYQIDATNCLLINGNQYAVALSGSGAYNFKHVTCGNYQSSLGRKTPGFYMSNTYESEPGIVQVRSISNSQFVNCIFSGLEKTEFDYDINSLAPTNFTFDFCLIKSEKGYPASEVRNSFFNQTPGFENSRELKFKPTAGAFIRQKGTNAGVFFDLEGNNRNNNTPDLGAYEYQP